MFETAGQWDLLACKAAQAGGVYLVWLAGFPQRRKVYRKVGRRDA